MQEEKERYEEWEQTSHPFKRNLDGITRTKDLVMLSPLSSDVG